jgi:hypothetical protein
MLTKNYTTENNNKYEYLRLDLQIFFFSQIELKKITFKANLLNWSNVRGRTKVLLHLLLKLLLNFFNIIIKF